VHGISPGCLLIEAGSTNCAANAWESKRILSDLGLGMSSAILIQDPTMQARTHASFQRAWRDEPRVRFSSFAPFVPDLQPDDSPSGFAVEPAAWPVDRFLALLMGEIPRLEDAPGGYGPSGRDFIEHVDIPDPVFEAYQRLRNDLDAGDRAF